MWTVLQANNTKKRRGAQTKLLHHVLPIMFRIPNQKQGKSFLHGNANAHAQRRLKVSRRESAAVSALTALSILNNLKVTQLYSQRMFTKSEQRPPG